jgi:hypothetical protein
MNRGRAGFDRIVTFILFLLFAGLAFWGIGLHFSVPAAELIGDVSDRDFWSGLADRDRLHDHPGSGRSGSGAPRPPADRPEH